VQKTDKIYVAGHKGMVGSALVRLLSRLGYSNLVLRSSKELDLRNQQAVFTFFEREKPDYVMLAAAKVGGISANNRYRAEFIYDNLMMEANVIHAAYLGGVKKLLLLGSSCIYPKHCEQPIKESYLLTGLLEPTNQPYAIAKIAGIELCRSYRSQYGCNFISVMPTNLYGPNDNYDLANSHVLPALVRKFAEAKKENAPTVTVWGSGTPRREFLHVDDLASACLFLMNVYDEAEPINVGTGTDLTIRELAELIKETVNYQGEICYDPSMPDGTPRKLLDCSRIGALGWKPEIGLAAGIREIVNEFMSSAPGLKKGTP
jgi:GDP-L-fucose synthase